MPTENIITLLIQIPLVSIFVWYTMHMSREFQAFLKERDQQWQAVISRNEAEFVAAVKQLAYEVSRNTAIILLTYKGKASTEEMQRILESKQS